MELKITKATTDSEIQGILDLHQANLRKNLSQEEMSKYGFVRMEYDLDLLKAQVFSPFLMNWFIKAKG